MAEAYLSWAGPRGVAGCRRSHDALNRVVEALGRGVVTVVPITTNVDRVYPCGCT